MRLKKQAIIQMTRTISAVGKRFRGTFGAGVFHCEMYAWERVMEKRFDEINAREPKTYPKWGDLMHVEIKGKHYEIHPVLEALIHNYFFY